LKPVRYSRRDKTEVSLSSRHDGQFSRDAFDKHSVVRLSQTVVHGVVCQTAEIFSLILSGIFSTRHYGRLKIGHYLKKLSVTVDLHFWFTFHLLNIAEHQTKMATSGHKEISKSRKNDVTKHRTGNTRPNHRTHSDV